MTQEQWIDTLKYFDNSCAYCGMSNEDHIIIFNENLHQEHIIAVTKGGSYTKSNIIPACRRCNSSKGNKSLLHFITYKKISKKFTQKIYEYINSNK